MKYINMSSDVNKELMNEYNPKISTYNKLADQDLRMSIMSGATGIAMLGLSIMNIVSGEYEKVIPCAMLSAVGVHTAITSAKEYQENKLQAKRLADQLTGKLVCGEVFEVFDNIDDNTQCDYCDKTDNDMER